MTTVSIMVLIVLIIVIGIVYLKRHPLKEMQASPRGEDYIGKIFTLEYPIINGTGVLQVDHTTWRISCVDLPAGARIKIVNTDGMILIAEPNQN